jgi:glycosyltransferase involved in cell wall biosynthesis
VSVCPGKVVYVCTDPGVPVFGCKGSSVHVQAVLRVLVSRGAEVHLVAARTGGDPPAGLEPVQVHPLSRVPKGDVADRERGLQAADAGVAAILDAVAASGDVDVVYERYALWGRAATAWAAAAGVPSVLEVNAPLVEEQGRHRQLADRAAADDVARAALGTADVVACVSDGVADWARRRSARPDRVHVVPNGVDVERVRPASRAVTGASETPFVLGFVGTLKPWHGLEVLVEALALLHRREPAAYRLLVVGAGPQAEPLAAQAERLEVADLVETTGAVQPADVPALLHRMDVATAPYPDGDDCYFSPLKVYEYLAAGLAVVASSVGQVPDALDHGRLGVLVAPGRSEELAEAVAGLRADEPRRRDLRAAARAAAVQRHGWDGVVDTVLRLLPAGAREVAA